MLHLYILTKICLPLLNCTNKQWIINKLMIENGDLTGEKKDTLSGETDEGGNSWDVIEDHMANSRGHHHHQPDHLVTLDLHWRNFRCHLGSGASCS